MQMEGILYGIGTGPGDPALITQKATAVIQSCELILIPAKSPEECYAYRIVKELIPEIARSGLGHARDLAGSTARRRIAGRQAEEREKC